MEKQESCGVFGISCNDFTFSVAGMIYSGLMALQHRGQLFTGLSTFSNGKLFTFKDRGIVAKVLNPQKLKIFSGNIGIGHVNYGSKRLQSVEDAQPFHYKSVENEFSIAFNGKITNYDDICERLKKMGRIFTGNTDVELLATLIDTFSKFAENNNIKDTFKMIMEVLEGAYSIVLLKNDGNLYALRDPMGYKPLCYGKLEMEEKKFYIVASESCALDILGAELKADITPGEMVKINPINGIQTWKIREPQNLGPCVFEYIYFARPDSVIDAVSVANVRYRLGRCLARLDNFDPKDYIVVPVPDSGRSAAMGYAWESKIPYEEGLIKNRYVWQLKVSDLKEKLNPIKKVVKGKNIILIDDSILSGETIKEILFMLRKVGVKSIHVRVSAPPVIDSCDKNDFLSNKELLIAYQMMQKEETNYIEEICKYIGADSLKYQSIEGLIKSIGLENSISCHDCFENELKTLNGQQSNKIKLLYPNN